jgi:prepilin-type processing-associated H-X9-DG protein
MSYASGNNDKLVNGAPESPFAACSVCSTGDLCGATIPTTTSDPYHVNELPWIGSYNITTTSDCGKKCAIDSGALWRYIQDYKLYHCPTGMKGETVTYSIVDGMNGRPDGRAAATVPAGIWKKTLGQIRSSATQVVFVDEGRITADSFAVTYASGGWSPPGDWFDGPDARHGNGTTVSLADGHAEYWQWCPDTVNYAKMIEPPNTLSAGYYFPVGPLPPGMPTPSDAAYQDLYKMTIGCWGRLDPSIIVAGHPSKVE